MKKTLLLFFAYLCICALTCAKEPLSSQQQVLALEKQMAVALVATDKETLTTLFAEDLMVNNPGNSVLTNRDQVMARVDRGIIRYESFEQTVEEVREYEGMVIVMGQETVRPSKGAPGAGHTLQRRFTDIWMLRDGVWKLTLRHANVIPPKPKS
ncbi:nuclear transport factor 2 family protein [Kiritimatiellaeota bacterium B1221]|nr:nuclear transport factor 2 family protein [Kiritimatiellaeota bacterium B1221]